MILKIRIEKPEKRFIVPPIIDNLDNLSNLNNLNNLNDLMIRIEKPEKSPIVPPIRPSCATIVTFQSMFEKKN